LVDPWRLVFTKQAQKDAKRLSSANLRSKAEELLEILKKDPFRNPPRYEKLVGDLAGAYSRRTNIQHRLVYQVLEEERVVKILRMWTHYE
jgi:Txe/YoeB family toxin of toxin-antitoxin system